MRLTKMIVDFLTFCSVRRRTWRYCDWGQWEVGRGMGEERVTNLFFVDDVYETVCLVQCVWDGEGVEIDLFDC